MTANTTILFFGREAWSKQTESVRAKPCRRVLSFNEDGLYRFPCPWSARVHNANSHSHQDALDAPLDHQPRIKTTCPSHVTLCPIHMGRRTLGGPRHPNAHLNVAGDIKEFGKPFGINLRYQRYVGFQACQRNHTTSRHVHDSCWLALSKTVQLHQATNNRSKLVHVVVTTIFVHNASAIHSEEALRFLEPKPILDTDQQPILRMALSNSAFPKRKETESQCH